MNKLFAFSMGIISMLIAPTYVFGVTMESDSYHYSISLIDGAGDTIKTQVDGRQSGWVVPTERTHNLSSAKAKKTEEPSTRKKRYVGADGRTLKEEPKYMQGAVTETADGSVEFVLDLDVPGVPASELYKAIYDFLDGLAQEEEQIQSRVVLFNEGEHTVAAKYKEWLTFKRMYLSLDRTEFNYTLIAKCTDGHVKLTMSSLSYDYEKDRPGHVQVKAEDWITDKIAINKKGNDLRSAFSKFRKATIDRKDEIFQKIRSLYRLESATSTSPATH